MTHRPKTAISRALVVVLLAVGAITLGAPSASAAITCPYDTFSRTSTVNVPADTSLVTIKANGLYLDVNDVFCALLAEVNSVLITVAPGTFQRVVFNTSTGPLGPGFTNEGNGSSEIEFQIAGMHANSRVEVVGTSGPDVIRAGQYLDRFEGVTTGQINLNGAADGATPDVDVSFTQFPGEMWIDGGVGDDVLSGAGTGTIFTGATSIPLYVNGRLGANTVTGGSGDDHIVFHEEAAGDGPDTLIGGNGFDLVQAVTTGATTTGSISLDGVANDGSRCPGVTCNGDSVATDFEHVAGSSISETITGNSAAQVLTGGGGSADTLNGLGGADVFSCISGVVNGGAGNDLIRPFPNCQVISGGVGKDTANFQPFPTPPVAVTLDNLPNDGAVGGSMNVRTNVEHLVGTQLNDLLSGSGKANTIDGFLGNDQIYGQGGNDTLIPFVGLDLAIGGAGTDRLSFASSTTPVTVDAVAETTTGQGNDTFSSIETFMGSAFNDVLVGRGISERLVGGDGDDTLSGNGGADTLQGGDGNDNLDGGAGTDVCTQGAGTGTVVNCE